jgi:hypothetical protein
MFSLDKYIDLIHFFNYLRAECYIQYCFFYKLDLTTLLVNHASRIVIFYGD